MKAVNFYNYNNRERSLRRIYLCGGGVAVDQIRAAICRVTDLDVHNAEGSRFLSTTHWKRRGFTSKRSAARCKSKEALE